MDVLVSTINAALTSEAAAVSANKLLVSTQAALAELKPPQIQSYKNDLLKSLLQHATFDTLKDVDGALIFESAHPFGNNLDELTSIKVPGAQSLYVAFDPRTSMEQSHDWVQLLKSDKKSCWGEEKYSGTNPLNYPGVPGGSKPILRINAEEFFVKFHTDYSGTGYGWRLVCVEVYV